MKRGVLWILLALLVGLAGCSRGAQEAPAQADEPPAGTPRARRRFLVYCQGYDGLRDIPAENAHVR